MPSFKNNNKELLIEEQCNTSNPVPYNSDLYLGKRYGAKLTAALEICAKERITLAEVVYIGDGVNCKELLEAVGHATCPVNARLEIKLIPEIYLLSAKDGDGAVREWAELILKNSSRT